MNCEDRAEQLVLFTAGQLGGAALDELDDHLETGCERCNQILDELEAEGVAHMQGSDLAHVRARLLGRAHADTAAADARGGSVGRRLVGLAALLALALAGTAGWLAWTTENERARLEAERAALALELEDAIEERARLELQVADLETELADFKDAFSRVRREARLLRSDDLQVVEMAAAETQPEASARIFWHRKDYRCFFHGLGLEPPPEGRRYVLWVLTDEDVTLAAGSFEPAFDGEATLFAALPRGIRSIKRAVVTDEPVEFGEAPTGAEQLVWAEAAL